MEESVGGRNASDPPPHSRSEEILKTLKSTETRAVTCRDTTASRDSRGSAGHTAGFEELQEGPGSGRKSVSPGNVPNLKEFPVTLLGIFMQVSL